MSKVVKVKAQKFILSGGGQTDEGRTVVGPYPLETRLLAALPPPLNAARCRVSIYAAGSLTDQDLRELGLCYEPTMSLAVKTIRTKSELEELRDKALEAADKAEAQAED